ncbi:uncharacterized protein LOC144074536 [Stigmatopora argus]
MKFNWLSTCAEVLALFSVVYTFKQEMMKIKSLTHLLKMTTQGVILIFLLQYQVILGSDIHIFAKAGDGASLPCRRPSCHNPDWGYTRDYSAFVYEVKHGQVQASSTRSHRLSLNNDGSLLIQRVTAEDAGYFTCDLQQQRERVYLTVLTLTASPLDSNGEVVLRCSLADWPPVRSAFGNRKFAWLDEEGQELPKEPVLQDNCTSTLTVLPVSPERTYTCQYKIDNAVIVYVQKTFVFLSKNASEPGNTRVINAIRVVVAILMLLFFGVLVVKVMVKSKRNVGRPTQVLQRL